MWIYKTSGRGGLVKTITYGALFTKAELEAVPRSTSGSDWADHASIVAKGAKLTLKAYAGAPVIVDLAARTASRKH